MKRKTKISATQALMQLNTLPKTTVTTNYGSRETLQSFKHDYEQQEAAKALEPINAQAAENARMRREIDEKERERSIRETRNKLMFKPSFDFDAPLYVDEGFTPEQITHNIGAAFSQFRQGDGANLSDPELFLIKEFLQLNTQYQQFDLTNPQTWILAQQFIESKLNPESEQELGLAAQHDATVLYRLTIPAGPQELYTPEVKEAETPEPVLDRDSLDKRDRQIRDAGWTEEFLPIFRYAVDSLERSSGLVMKHEQMCELARHYDKRSANSKRPIPMSVYELRKTAYQLWGNEIGPIENDRPFLLDEDSQLSSDDLKRKYGFANSYSKNIALAADSWRK